jgi:hypothetical protein
MLGHFQLIHNAPTAQEKRMFSRLEQRDKIDITNLQPPPLESYDQGVPSESAIYSWGKNLELKNKLQFEQEKNV